MEWHHKEVWNVFKELETTASGLTTAEAGERLARYGPNELKEKGKRSVLLMLLAQFKDFMISVLLAAALISGLMGEVSDTVTILIIVVLNGVVGFIQEYRAEKAMEALKRMAGLTATVVRDGTPRVAPSATLVPGDVMLLEAGRVVPADMRVMEEAELRVDEAALTGESLPVEKETGALPEGPLPLGDRTNMVFKGTTVSYGRGTAVVIATGMNTELGRIAAMIQEEGEVRTPLQKRLAAFSRKLAFAVLAICAIVLAVGVMRGEKPLLMLLTAISLAVAAIPEALPAVITVSLALGAKKLAAQKALMRKLPAVETLGSVTYICSDKTGTLTQNRMTVEQVFLDGQIREAKELSGTTLFGPLRDLFLAGLAVSNDAEEDGSGNLMGDPTETALVVAAAAHGFRKNDLLTAHPRVAEVPFDSGRKCMTTFHEWEGGYISFTKGALDELTERSPLILTAEGEQETDPEEMRCVLERMAAQGLRVLALAMRRWEALPSDMSPSSVETGLTLLGMAGMMDPPREEAKEAVARCREAGIVPVMITGDHPLTARTIGVRLGMIAEGSRAVLTGRDLARLDAEGLKEQVEHVRVYARVAPEQKLRIVKALQERGQYVAMTGDGVNDAPALKRADIGIAMGITGTDVSKEAAHMILLDDNFATIVGAVAEGRKIYDNIRKFIKYLLTTNSGEIWTLFLAPLVGLPIPLLPIHILWINLVTDGLPALALSVEPAEGDVMTRPPRNPRESIFAGGLGVHAVWVGLLMAGVVLFIQTWSIKTGHSHWQTMVFTVLCMTQLGHVLAIRSERQSLFTIGIFSNMRLFGAVALTFLMQMATIYIPALNPIFKTVPLNAGELFFTLALSSVVFFAVETEKLVKRRKGW